MNPNVNPMLATREPGFSPAALPTDPSIQEKQARLDHLRKRKRLYELQQKKALATSRAQVDTSPIQPMQERESAPRPLVRNNRQRALPPEYQRELNSELQAMPNAVRNGPIGGFADGIGSGLGGKYLAAASDFAGRGIANLFRPDDKDKPNNYADHLEAQRQRYDWRNEDAGAGDDLGSLFGTGLGLGKLARGGVTATRFVPQGLSKGKAAIASTGALAADGAALGGLDALLSGGNVGKTMARDGALTAGADLVLRGSGKSLARMADPIRRMDLPTASQIKGKANAAYDALGARAEPVGDSIQDLLARVTGRLNAPDVALNKALQPATSRMVRDMKKLTPDDRVAELINLRKRAKRVSGGKGEDNHAAKLLNQELDGFMSEQMPDAFAALRNADGLWAQGKNVKRIDDALKAARQSTWSSGSGGNTNNNVRRAMQKVATGKHSKYLPQEAKDQALSVVKGSPLNNAGRLVGGALDPTTSKLNLGIQAAAAAVGTPVTGGVSLAAQLPLAAVGFGSRVAADRGTIRAARDVSLRIRAMGLDIPESQIQKMLADPRQAAALARLLGQGAAPAAAQSDRTGYRQNKQDAALRLAGPSQ